MQLCFVCAFLLSCFVQNSSIDELVAKIAKLDFPNITAVKAAGQDYMVELEKYKVELDASVMLLAKSAPEHPDLPKFLIRRWEHCDVVIVAGRGRVLPEYWLSDIEKIRALPLSPAAIEACDFQTAYRKGWAESKNQGAVGRIAKEFIQAYPKSQYIDKLLMDLVAKCTDRDDSIALLDAWLENYPEKTPDRVNAEARRRLWTHVGEKVELKFKDELSGDTFDIQDHRGKVVVVEFWSTTCPPCFSVMRELKKMDESSEYDGMVVVGIAQDAGDAGRAAMKQALEKEGIAWPQYFQDSPWDGPFSTEMGVRRLPTTLLVGKDGKLRPICERHRIPLEVSALLKENFAR
jgi:thiol-disulfide isomerase/thioredoxin